jgi:hypothetical protein
MLLRSFAVFSPTNSAEEPKKWAPPRNLWVKGR